MKLKRAVSQGKDKNTERNGFFNTKTVYYEHKIRAVIKRKVKNEYILSKKVYFFDTKYHVQYKHQQRDIKKISEQTENKQKGVGKWLETQF